MLPPPDPNRWNAARKAQVVVAVDLGLLTLAEACGRYDLSPEEFGHWWRRYHHDGLAGLRITQTQLYRKGS
jgi:transposase-like protein